MLRYGALAIAMGALFAGEPRAHAAAEVADAAMRSDHAALRQALRENFDVNEPQADGATALHWAAYRGDAEAARLLLDAGAEATAANRAGATPMSLACTAGDAEVIGLLLDAGVDSNEHLRNGETPLMMAARTGSVAAVGLLLDRGADVNAAETLRGTTPLMWAVAYEHPAVVALLLEQGADVAARSKLVPRGRRPYLADTTRSRIEDFKRGVGQAGRSIPVDLGADGNSRPVSDEDLFGDGAEPPRAAPASGPATPPAPRPASDEDVDAPPRNATADQWGGLTALVFAARQGSIESTRLLLAAGAEINQPTEYGWTPLLAAIHNRYYRLALFLLENGADPKLSNKGGWSPLYLATDNRNIEGGDYPTRKADLDHLELIDALLARGADVNTRMRSSTETRTIFTHQWLHEEGATPLLRAAQSGDLTLVDIFLEHGADPKLATEDGTTALMVAAGIGWVEGVTYEWSPARALETVERLIDLGVPVDAQNLDGQTALMGAAHKGRNDVVELLVARGADLALRDIGSRDTIHVLAGLTWQAIDYADGLVRVGVQSAIPHPETAALLRRLMLDRGLAVPPEGRTLDSICVVEICQ
jgi:ankyrin repeat protein